MTVEHLKKRVQERMDWRAADKIKQERLQARQKEINAAPSRKVTDFWCDKCDNDYTTLGFKHYNDEHAWYVGECPCGEDNRRRITDMNKDQYYRRSRNVQRDLRKHEKDIRQRYEQTRLQT